jgi:hypothetical protein
MYVSKSLTLYTNFTPIIPVAFQTLAFSCHSKHQIGYQDLYRGPAGYCSPDSRTPVDADLPGYHVCPCMPRFSGDNSVFVDLSSTQGRAPSLPFQRQSTNYAMEPHALQMYSMSVEIQLRIRHWNHHRQCLDGGLNLFLPNFDALISAHASKMIYLCAEGNDFLLQSSECLNDL